MYTTFKLGDFEIELNPSDNPEYDNLSVSIDQGGYYGASANSSLYDVELDRFLEECVRFKEIRDNKKNK